MKKTDDNLRRLIIALKRAGTKGEAPIWRDLSERLTKPTRGRPVINLSRLNRHTNKGETIVVPGKVLSTGELEHKLTIAALTFSEKARDKITKAGGKTLSIEEMIKKHPKGTDVRVMV